MLAVDVGLAELQFAAGLHGGVQIVGEDARSQTVFAVVGHGDDLVEGLELDERNHGAEGLLMDDVHVLTAVVKYGGCVEVALRAYALTTAEQLGTLLDGTLHLLGDALQGTLFYQRAHVDALVGAGVAHLHGFHLIDQNLCELCLHLLLYIDTLCIVAYLAVVTDAAVNNPLCGTLQIGILHHDGRSLTAQLE